MNNDQPSEGGSPEPTPALGGSPAYEPKPAQGLPTKAQASKAEVDDQSTTTSLKPKALPKLTRKQERFVQEIVRNPKISATAAAKAAYNTSTENSAAQIASENLRKPQVMAELAKYVSRAEYNLMVLADKSTEYAMLGGHVGAAYAGVSQSVNNSILDRIFGKATTKVEATSTSVNINIDLAAVAE